MSLDKKIETFAELSILAMSMFFAAFFCMRMLFIPDNAERAVKKIYEVEEAISEREPSSR